MVYIVVRTDEDPACNIGPYQLFVGWSKNSRIIELYLDFLESKLTKTTNSVSFRIIQMSDNKFSELQQHDPKVFACPEVDYVNKKKGIVLSDDDYEFIESNMSEKVTEMEYHLREAIETLKFFDNKEVRDAVKVLKKVKKKFECDYTGEDVWADLDWERCSKKIIL